MNDHEQVNDDALTRELRESLADMTAPQRPTLETITARGRAHQRHRLLGIAGQSAAGVAAGTSLALGLTGVVGAAPPRSSGSTSHPAHAQLAAWTVVKRRDGTVFVRIRELRDPAGLQHRLRADGIPASVQFYPGNPVGKSPLAIVQFKGNPCQQYSGGQSKNNNVVTGRHPLQDGFTIHPSAIPSGAGVQIVASRSVGYYSPQHPEPIALFEWLVQPSRQCTGS
jgi:hypothetical protein